MSEIALYLMIAVVPLYSAIGAMIGAWLGNCKRGDDR